MAQARRSKRGGKSASADRRDQPPTWRGALDPRRASSRLLLFPVSLLFGQPVGGGDRPDADRRRSSTCRSASTPTILLPPPASRPRPSATRRSRRASRRRAERDGRPQLHGRPGRREHLHLPPRRLRPGAGHRSRRRGAAAARPRSSELGLDARGDPAHPLPTSTTSAPSRRSRRRPARPSTAPSSRCRCSPTS